MAGLAWGLPLREAAPGVYRGALVVRPGMDVRDSFVLGRLDGEVRVGPRVSLAPRPPRVLEVHPTGEVAGDNPVSALYESPGALVDASRVRLRLDGRDVTGLARRTVGLVFLQPAEPLAPGPHRAELVVVDTAGNRTVHGWTFTVRPPSRG